MECLQCDLEGRHVPAVALCPKCHTGLCLDHLNETRRTRGPGGMNYTCHHDKGVLKRKLPALRVVEMQEKPKVVCELYEGCVC